MALVKIEPYGVDNIANFTFGGLTITSNAVFGNASLGNLATANFVTVLSNLTSGNANLGNAATANYFIGNGSLLTGITTTSIINGTSNVVVTNNGNASISIGGTSNVVIITTTGANVNGYVSATRFVGEAGNLSNLQGANVSGAVASATVAATVTTAAQPNITSLGLLANLSVNGNSSFIGNANIVGNINQSGGTSNISNLTITGNVIVSGSSVNLGDISNLHISGGSANYVLQTDGVGNLSWVNAGSSSSTTPGDVVVDNFTGDGSNASFTLSTTPSAVKYVIVNVDGVFQLRQSYSVTGNVLTFGSAPLASSLIEVSTTLPGTILGGAVDLGNITQDVVPSANITYSLGTSTKRWKDLYLSGTTIDLAGATIKTDAATGAIALIPTPTDAVPNPTGIVITASGTLSTVETSNGIVNTSAIANAVSNSTINVSAPTSFVSTVDTFIGNGTGTTYSLSSTPADKNYTIVMIDGVMQPRSAYTISGTTFALSAAAPNSAVIEVTTMGGNASAPTQTLPDILSPFMFIGI